MNKSAVYISTAWLVSTILFCGMTYWLSHSKPIPVYKQDSVLLSRYDSLALEVKKKDTDVKHLRVSVDSIIKYSVYQQYTIDSLLAYKKNKKVIDEKNYNSVSTMSDSLVNATLSDKLK